MYISVKRLLRGLLLGWAMIGMIAAAQAADYTLNMKDAEIEAVVTTVAEITGKNFIIDPRVKGKVTIVSTRSLTKEEIYQVFLATLEVHGFAAVSSGKVIKVIPDANVKHTAQDLPGAAARLVRDDAITEVIHMQNVSAAQLVPILRPLVPPQGHLAAHPQSNVLIVADRFANVERIKQIIARIDQPASAEIEVIQLRHASASELVRILSTLDQQAKQRDPQAERPTLVADERTNSILISGELSDRLQMRAIIAHLDTPTEMIGNTHVIYLRYAKAKELVQVLTGVAESQAQEQKGKAPGAAQEIYQIQADESTNALVITAPPDVFRSLEGVVRKLDVRRAQVLVEAIIAEVSSERAAELGVQWLFDATPGGQGPVGAINFGGSGSGILQIGAAIQSGGLPTPDGATFGIGKFDSSNFNFGALLRALQGDGSTNVLSTPSLVTMDNQEAEIVVGQNVPFVTGSFTNTGATSGATNPFQTITRENVGITLKVNPQINEGDAVKLEIEQKVDSIAPSSQGAADIITNTRSIKTSVLVDDGKVVVLGGLIQDDLNESVQKVPLLGDLPVIGALFRYKSTRKVKRNLMVFLQPTILRDVQGSMNVTSAKYNYIRAKQLDLRQKGVPLLPDEHSPALPTLEEVLAEPASVKVQDERVEQLFDD